MPIWDRQERSGSNKGTGMRFFSLLGRRWPDQRRDPFYTRTAPSPFGQHDDATSRGPLALALAIHPPSIASTHSAGVRLAPSAVLVRSSVMIYSLLRVRSSQAIPSCRSSMPLLRLPDWWLYSRGAREVNTCKVCS